jgi:hypothetical protein
VRKASHVTATTQRTQPPPSPASQSLPSHGMYWSVRMPGLDHFCSYSDSLVSVSQTRIHFPFCFSCSEVFSFTLCFSVPTAQFVRLSICHSPGPRGSRFFQEGSCVVCFPKDRCSQMRCTGITAEARRGMIPHDGE